VLAIKLTTTACYFYIVDALNKTLSDYLAFDRGLCPRFSIGYIHQVGCVSNSKKLVVGEEGVLLHTQLR
jgi:hypothetical protein